ncbi:hypothetical protein ACOME3_000964 [Neoechinorhynchus agilis]
MALRILHRRAAIALCPHDQSMKWIQRGYIAEMRHIKERFVSIYRSFDANRLRDQCRRIVGPPVNVNIATMNDDTLLNVIDDQPNRSKTISKTINRTSVPKKTHEKCAN